MHIKIPLTAAIIPCIFVIVFLGVDLNEQVFDLKLNEQFNS